MTAVFISYRRGDSGQVAGRLFDALCDVFGKTHVFRDVDAIPGGSDFEDKIRESIARSDVVLAVIGPNWSTIADETGRRRLDDPEDLLCLELRIGLESGKRVIPVLVDGARMPKRDKVPAFLHRMLRIQSVEVIDRRFEDDIRDLVEAIEGWGLRMRLQRWLRRFWMPIAAGGVAAAGASALAYALYLRMPPIEAEPIDKTLAVLEDLRRDCARRLAAAHTSPRDKQARIEAECRRLDEMLAHLPQTNRQRNEAVQDADKQLAQSGTREDQQARRLLRQGNPDPARARLAELADGVDPVKAAEAASELGRLDFVSGAFGASASRLRQAARLQPGNAIYLTDAGLVELELGNLDAAQRDFEAALEIRHKTLQPGDAALFDSQVNLARVYKEQRRNGDAQALLLEALNAEQARASPDVARVALATGNLAQLYRAAAPTDEAANDKIEALLKKAVELQRQARGPQSLEVATAQNNLAAFRAARGEFGDAQPLYQSAFAIREKHLPPDHPDIAASLNNMAALHAQENRPQDAEPLLRRALEIQERAFGTEHRSVATTLNNLGMTYLQLGRHDDARVQLRRSIEIQTTAGSVDKVKLALTRNTLALVFMDERRLAEAEALLADASTVLLAELPARHADVQKVVGNYAECLRQLGRGDEAQAWMRRLEAQPS